MILLDIEIYVPGPNQGSPMDRPLGGGYREGVNLGGSSGVT